MKQFVSFFLMACALVASIHTKGMERALFAEIAKLRDENAALQARIEEVQDKNAHQYVNTLRVLVGKDNLIDYWQTVAQARLQLIQDMQHEKTKGSSPSSLVGK